MIDILAIMAHPDDLESGAGGFMLKAKSAGKKTGLIILTRGEAGGCPGTRTAEAAKGAKILGIDYFVHLDFSDGFLKDDDETAGALLPMVTECSPSIMIKMHGEDCHPDHAAASGIVEKLAFRMHIGKLAGKPLKRKLRHLLSVPMDPKCLACRPDILLDVSDVWDAKMKSVAAHESQKVEVFTETMGRYFGMMKGVDHAEAFMSRTPLFFRDIGAFFC